MIGEINGHSVNSEVPINAGRVLVLLSVVGFTDSLFTNVGFYVDAELYVVGFEDSLVDPVIFWSEEYDGIPAQFCSEVIQTEFDSCGDELVAISAPVEEICEFESETIQTEFSSIKGANTRGEC